MNFRPNPKQALLLWRMLTATTEEERSPMQSKAKPELKPAERAELLRVGFLELDKQKRGARLVLTDTAWAWASSDNHVELLKSNSAIGATALEGLLRRLIPFLQAREISLGELFSETIAPKKERDAQDAVAVEEQSLVKERVERACRELFARKPGTAIRLTQLRAQLKEVPRSAVDAELARLHAAGRIALYRDDNCAAVTTDDERAALSVGGEPRHLLYWKE
ncbi:MAG: hypothetical protein QM784_39235 [Polyangiaceae bacterium]